MIYIQIAIYVVLAIATAVACTKLAKHPSEATQADADEKTKKVAVL